MFRSIAFIAGHPLTKGHVLSTFGRVMAWQIGTRLLKSPVAVPFVDDTRLLVRRGMTGATGNVYCGLHDFADMGFVLHALGPDDLFVDIGANIGAYTVLASGAAGARTIAIEPAPATFSGLLDNLHINDLMARVEPKNVGLGGTAGTVAFTSGLKDTVNHVACAADENVSTITIPVVRLDTMLAGRRPAVIKMDVEGFESAVIEGAGETLRSPSLLAVLMELNGSGRRYGFDEEALHRRMLGHGFIPGVYDPWTRALREAPARNIDGNTLYIRPSADLRARVSAARRHRVRDSLV